MMDLDLKFLISILTSGAGIGAAWGHSQSKIHTLTERLEEIKKDSYKIYTGILFLLSVTFVHNFSTYLSHFPIEYIKNL